MKVTSRGEDSSAGTSCSILARRPRHHHRATPQERRRRDPTFSPNFLQHDKAVEPKYDNSFLFRLQCQPTVAPTWVLNAALAGRLSMSATSVFNVAQQPFLLKSMSRSDIVKWRQAVREFPLFEPLHVVHICCVHASIQQRGEVRRSDRSLHTSARAVAALRACLRSSICLPQRAGRARWTEDRGSMAGVQKVPSWFVVWGGGQKTFGWCDSQHGCSVC